VRGGVRELEEARPENNREINSKKRKYD